MERTTTSLLDLQIDPQCSSFLLETAKWQKFLAIVWFVLCGLMAIVSLFAGSMIASFYNSMPGMEGMSFFSGTTGGIAVTLIYLLFTAIQLIPNIFRYKFAVNAMTAVRNNDQLQLNHSLNNLRRYSKYWGILTIIIIAFYVLALIMMMVGGAIMMRG